MAAISPTWCNDQANQNSGFASSRNPVFNDTTQITSAAANQIAAFVIEI